MEIILQKAIEQLDLSYLTGTTCQLSAVEVKALREYIGFLEIKAVGVTSVATKKGT